MTHALFSIFGNRTERNTCLVFYFGNRTVLKGTHGLFFISGIEPYSTNLACMVVSSCVDLYIKKNTTFFCFVFLFVQEHQTFFVIFHSRGSNRRVSIWLVWKSLVFYFNKLRFQLFSTFSYNSVFFIILY